MLIQIKLGSGVRLKWLWFGGVVLTFCRFAQNLYVSKYGFRQEEWSANQGNPFGNLNTPRPGKSFNADGLCYLLLKQLYLFLVTCRLERAQAGKGPRPVCFVNSSRTEKRTQKEASRGLQDEKRDYHACWVWNFTATYYWSYWYESHITAELFEQTNTVSYMQFFWEYSPGPIRSSALVAMMMNWNGYTWVTGPTEMLVAGKVHVSAVIVSCNIVNKA
jgi:hypothetical protein